MRKGFFYFSIVLVLILSLAGTSAQTNIVDSMDFQGTAKELTISQAIEVAVKYNPDIIQEALNIEQSKIDSVRIIDGSLGVWSSSSVNGELQKDSNRLTGQYTLENSRRNYDCVVARVKAELEEAYYGVLQVQQNVDINKNSMDINKDLLDKTNKKYQLGLVSKQEVLAAEIGYNNAVNTYNSSVNDLKKSKMQLNIKLGFDVMNELKLKDELRYVTFDTGSIAKAVSSALQNRNEIKAKKYAFDLQKLSADAEKKLGETSNNYKMAKIKLEGAVKNLDTAYKNIEVEVRGIFLDIKQKQYEISSLQKSVELNKENFKIIQTKFDKGMAVLSDVQLAHNDLQKAELNLASAILKYNLLISKYKDSISVGRNKV